MIMGRRKRVSYLVKDFKKDVDGIVEIAWASKLVPTGNFKVYEGALGLVVSLSPSALRVFLFVLTKMDTEGMVLNSKLFKEEFNESSSVSYSDKTINNAFTDLVGFRLLLRPFHARRGVYQVNPSYFYQGSEKDREKAIRKYVEDYNRELINEYRRNQFTSPNPPQSPLEDFPEFER